MLDLARELIEVHTVHSLIANRHQSRCSFPPYEKRNDNFLSRVRRFHVISTNHEELWNAIQERCAALEPGTELVTPLSNRPFRVRETSADRLQIRFDDSGEKRVLWREQFEVLTDRLQEHRLAIVDLSPGVEPYATVLTLLADVVVENDEIASVSEREMGAGSPYLISPAEARTRPERLHDGAILLADLLDTLDSVDPDTLETGAR